MDTKVSPLVLLPVGTLRNLVAQYTRRVNLGDCLAVALRIAAITELDRRGAQ